MTTNYRASTPVAIVLGSMPSSSGLTAGRCSPAVTNAVNKDDAIAATLRATTSASPAPTAGGQIQLWAFAQREDGTWPELFTTIYTGAAGDFTAVSTDILHAGARMIGSVTVDAVAARPYPIHARELAMQFGFVPEVFAFFVVQSTGQPLNAAGNVLTIKAGSFA
jgi:hypothetical protein